ncbi:MAG: DUF2339 domain-containing protein [Ignavibacteria bacterium]
MNEKSETQDNSNNLEVIKNLQERLSQVEKQLSRYTAPSATTSENPALNNFAKEDDELELRIGELWLPKLGVLVFILGVVFSLTLPFKEIPAVIPSVCGYILALAILSLGFYGKKSFPHLSGYFIGGSVAIAYLSTLRLYFFGSENVLSSWVIELLILLFVISTTLWYAEKNKSVHIASLGIFLGYFTALTLENLYLFLFTILIFSSLSVYLSIRYQWQGLLTFSIIIAYLTHFIWFVGNPFFENTLDLLKKEINLFFILGYILVFAIGILRRKENSSEELSDVVCSLLNPALGYGLFLIITLLNTSPWFGELHLAAAVLFLIIAMRFWIKEKSQYSTFIYAMSGYAALSVAIIFQFDKPWNLVLLCWQSLLVLSTAVWFRSRFIIVSNFIIFLLVLVSYLINYWTLGSEAISFGLTALISARILNWQKERLELKTEQMRNSYLIIALFLIPYLFFCILPSVYVGLSLLLLSLIYFAVGKLLKNIKYRWMAVMTLLITVFYLMVFGITNPDTAYKIISFLSAGIVLIITSAVYSRIKAKIIKKI